MPYTDSESVTETLDLVGVWIHDPDAPDATLRNFPFGSAQRSDALDMLGTPSFYAGRTHPVYDFGEHETDVATVAIDVPHGLTYREDLAALREFARSRKSVWVRDNRGRAYFGPLEAFRITDAEWGAQVTFTVEQADRETTTAVV